MGVNVLLGPVADQMPVGRSLSDGVLTVSLGGHY